MHLPKVSRLLIAAALAILTLPSCNAQDGAKAETKTAAAATPANGPIATVNGVAIPQSRLDLVMKERAQQGQPDSPEIRKSAREDLINRELLAQEALKKGLDKDPEIATQIEVTRQSVLVRAYLQDYLKTHPVSDEQLKKEYELIKSQMGEKEYKARHILVGSEKEAKDLIAQIKKGAKFEKLASEKSKDTGSKAHGGDLDWSPAGNYVHPFADALTKLQKGQITQEPVQTQFGWHVIRLDDVRPLKVPGFDEVKPGLQQRMQQQQIQAAINDLRTKAKVE